MGDGWPTAGEGQAAGGIKFGSIEVTEVRFPLFLKRHEFQPNSAGNGKFRGGVGSVMEMHVEITEPAVANTAGDGVRYGACGMAEDSEKALTVIPNEVRNLHLLRLRPTADPSASPRDDNQWDRTVDCVLRYLNQFIAEPGKSAEAASQSSYL